MYKLVGLVFVLLIALMPSALGINVKGSSDEAGFSMDIEAADSDTVEAQAVLGESSVSNFINGKGNLEESHWASNDAGAKSTVGVKIMNANKYSYRYTLVPGMIVSASESLDVDYADYIKAWATAYSASGDDAGVDVEVTDGSLTGYTNQAMASADKADASESGHIQGTFMATSTADPANADPVSKIRNSNYGTVYDLLMNAHVGSPPEVAGNLVYHVDDDNGETIQGAVYAAESGDAIDVAEGTYYENVMVDESLEIKGAGADKTIVDGGGNGRVFTIYPNLEVTLADMTIQNGNAYADPYNPSGYSTGGGIFNHESTLTVENCDIRYNTALLGGGISNQPNYGTATTTVKSCDVHHNTAFSGGGISNWGFYGTGIVNIEKSNIQSNIASYHGGGLWSNFISGMGLTTIEKSSIRDNIAGYSGGGLTSYGQTTTIVKKSDITDNTASISVGGGIYSGSALIVDKSKISRNKAGINGGGIANFGTATITDSTISENTANSLGGGIYNSILSGGGTLTVDKSTITKNTAGINGGGIFNSGGTLTLTASQVTNNNPNDIAPP